MKIEGKVSNWTEEHILIKAVCNDKELRKRIRKCGGGCEISMLDARQISPKQRKKIYLIFGEVADYMGEIDIGGGDYVKGFLKGAFLDVNKEKGYNWFSLSNCSVEVAYEFIHYLIGFCLENSITTHDTLLHRCEDIESYMYMCLKHKKCALSNQPGEVHHIDAIGMGNNRRRLDDSAHLKICLNREYHTIAHTMGWKAFSKKYHVVGILYDDVDN